MYFFAVWVRSNRYHGSQALTYASTKKLRTGQLVRVPLQKNDVLAVVVGIADQPRFKTKPISEIIDLPLLPTQLIKLTEWLRDYYPAPIGLLTQQLVPANLSPKHIATLEPTKSSTVKLKHLPPLTSEQQKALLAMTKRGSYLLHGITGSGKTRIYLELAAQTMTNGKSAIVLTPEISLTTQLANSFRQVFAENVVVMHSQQTPAQRQKAWLKVLASRQPLIVIGPRSALFAPIDKLGLIVIDEAHEAAYKQEQAPQYQAGRVAAVLAQLARATLVLGSATPSVSDYYLAEQKDKPIIRLEKLARSTADAGDKLVTFVDRKDSTLFNRSAHFSQPLIAAIETALTKGEQSLLYLNRRGTARLVLCENCGWQASCPHCDIPLTYHGDDHSLRCHSCSHQAPVPISCPNCLHTSVIYKTAGTKAIADEAARLFPNARIGRFDSDNLRADRFESHYDAVLAGQVDILVGTQLLAKGLDLPRLSTLGIILAETSLYLPDFSAQERTYQLVSQVLGRIGRGHIEGRAVIQTYHPDHAVLQAAVRDDFQAFYHAELTARRQFLFPPFCYLLKLSVRRASSHSAESAAQQLKHELATSGLGLRVEGPAPSFYERFQHKYQWQLVVKAKHRQALIDVVKRLPANWSYDLDPLDLL